MSEIYNAEEVIEIACQIERNGSRYYRRAADVVSAPAAKELFQELAAMEEDHLLTFDGMRGDEGTRAMLLGDQEDIVLHYLQAVADGHVFRRDEDPADALSPGISEQDILRTAISMEKDSIVFYLGIRDAMAEGQGRDRVGMIIREEMSHITILSNRLADLSRT